jgi:hypothetical protein
MSLSEFGDWALDPKRTDEEAYFAERVVEIGVSSWRSRRKDYSGFDWETQQAVHKRRRLNPAHRARLKKTDVAHALEMLPETTSLYLDCYSDRPLRDLAGLRFFPNVTKLHIGWTEIADLSPLAQLIELEELHLTDKVAEDLRPLAALTKLRDIWLHLDQPWPRVDGLGALQQLESFRWHANMLVLEGLGPFPRVREAHFENAWRGLPLRDAARLPELPAVEVLHISDLYRLDGIERYRHVLNLELEGSFRTLEPLTVFTRLTHLSINNDEPLDLAPLCRLAELRSLKFTSVQPQEFFAISDAPHLHEVQASRCDANDREVATLQEVLKPWDEFAADKSRPVESLRLFSEDWTKGNVATERRKQWEDAAEPWPGNKGMQESEWKWISQQIQAALDKTFGKGWGQVSHAWLQIYSIEAADRLTECVDIIRGVLASCRRRHYLTFCIDLKTEWRQRDEEIDDDDDFEQERAEHEEWKIHQREEAELREREHRLRQLRQEGAKIDPAEFEPPTTEPPEPEAEEDDDDEVDEEEEEAHPQAEEYRLFGEINEEAVYIPIRDVETAERLLRRKAETRDG